MYFSGFSFSLCYIFFWLLTEVYSEPSRASTMKLLLRKYLADLSCYLFSQKKLHRKCSTGLKIGFWLQAKGLSRENSLPENTCDIVSEKMKGRGGTERVFMQTQTSEGFFKKVVLRNFATFTRKHLCEKNETLVQLFSCEFYQICKNICFAEHHHSTASD